MAGQQRIIVKKHPFKLRPRRIIRRNWEISRGPFAHPALPCKPDSDSAWTSAPESGALACAVFNPLNALWASVAPQQQPQLWVAWCCTLFFNCLKFPEGCFLLAQHKLFPVFKEPWEEPEKMEYGHESYKFRLWLRWWRCVHVLTIAKTPQNYNLAL